jgi:hypothetical protein
MAQQAPKAPSLDRGVGGLASGMKQIPLAGGIMSIHRLAVLALAVFLAELAPLRAELRVVGVNLAGAEFGGVIPGTFNVDYTYPSQQELAYSTPCPT